MLYKSLEKQDTVNKDVENEENKENNYDFIHKLLKVLTLLAKPLEVSEGVEKKVFKRWIHFINISKKIKFL